MLQATGQLTQVELRAYVPREQVVQVYAVGLR